MRAPVSRRTAGLFSAGIVALAVVLARSPAARAAAGPIAVPPGGVVRCEAERSPAWTQAAASRVAQRIRQNRFLAPTREAMFFSRLGDRCAWRPRRNARG